MKKYWFLFLILFLIPKTVSAATDWEEFVFAISSDDEIIEIENDIIGDKDIVIAKDKAINLNGYCISSAGSITIDGAEVKISNGKITSTDNNTLSIINGASVSLNESIVENTGYGGYSIYIKGANVDNDVKTKLLIDSGSSVISNFALGIQRNGLASYGVEVDVYGSIIGENTINTYNYGAVGIHVFSNISKSEGNVPKINIYDGANIIAKQGNNGDINADDAPAIYAEGYAKWNIFGGTIKGSEAITAFAGEFNIFDGNLIGIGDFYDTQIESNKSIATGSAITLVENSNFPSGISLNVAFGNITSEKAFAIYSLPSDNVQENSISSLVLSGGRYTGKEAALNVSKYDKFVNGGCYNGQVDTDYLNFEDLSIVEDNKHYCVGLKNEIIIEESNKKFVSVNIDKAVAGQSVKIVPKELKGYKILSYDVRTASGKIVKIDNGVFIMPNEQVIVEVNYVEDIINPDTSDNIYLVFMNFILSFIGFCTLIYVRIKG